MKILAIDYGRSKMGLAISQGRLAEPLEIIRYKDIKKALKRITELVRKENIDKVVVGVSEGKMAKESENFAGRLKKIINLTVETFDETLTSYEAQEFSKEANIRRKKRKLMEDAYAAAIILQRYLDG
jgi:putative Holliday junction resolvase